MVTAAATKKRSGRTLSGIGGETSPQQEERLGDEQAGAARQKDSKRQKEAERGRRILFIA